MFKTLDRRLRRSLHLEPKPGNPHHELDRIEYKERQWLQRERSRNWGSIGMFDCYICNNKIKPNPRLCNICQPWNDISHIVYCRAETPDDYSHDAYFEELPGIGAVLGDTTGPSQRNLVPQRVNFLPLQYYSSNRGCIVCGIISRALEHTLAVNQNARVAILRPFPVLHPLKRLPTVEGDSVSTAFLGEEFRNIPRMPVSRAFTGDMLQPMSERCVLPICVKGPSSRDDAATHQRFDIELELEYEHHGYDLRSAVKWDRSHIDLNHIQTWLTTCELQHGEACNSPIYAMTLPDGFRLVDTEHWCVVEPRQAVEYATLSYVWSLASPRQSAVDFKLELGNEQTLSRRGSLRGADLPEVILDAMQLCSDLGQRYLWVDRLCVLQDGGPEKMAQLNAMDVIYHLAKFSIVHLGEKKWPGLPGISSRPRNYTLTDKPWTFYGGERRAYAELPDISDAVDGSEWNTRGWTYQERMLSRRHIFVSSDEVYLNCGSQACVGWMPHHGKKSKDRSFEKGMGTDLYLGDYKIMAMEYTKRELGVKSDILNAFAGVAAVLSKKLDTEFLHGLPERYLLKALLWSSARSNLDPPKLRDMTNKFSKAVVSFPSWSWAAWQVAVYYPTEKSTLGTSSYPPSLNSLDLADDPSSHRDAAPNDAAFWEESKSYGHLVWMHYMDPDRGLRPVNEERVWFSGTNKLTDLNDEYRSVTYQSNLEDWGVTRPRRAPTPMDHPSVRGAPGYFRQSGRPWGEHSPDPVDSWSLSYPIDLWRGESIEMWRNFIQSPWEGERRRHLPEDKRQLAESIPNCLVFNTTYALLGIEETPAPVPGEVFHAFVDDNGVQVGASTEIERRTGTALHEPGSKCHVIVMGAAIQNFLDPIPRRAIDAEGLDWNPQSPWSLNVMVVKKRGSVYTRLACGWVNLKDWSRCKPRWETVILV